MFLQLRDLEASLGKSRFWTETQGRISSIVAMGSRRNPGRWDCVIHIEGAREMSKGGDLVWWHLPLIIMLRRLRSVWSTN